jgi:hypothetical protein
VRVEGLTDAVDGRARPTTRLGYDRQFDLLRSVEPFDLGEPARINRGRVVLCGETELGILSHGLRDDRDVSADALDRLLLRPRGVAGGS